MVQLNLFEKAQISKQVVFLFWIYFPISHNYRHYASLVWAILMNLNAHMNWAEPCIDSCARWVNKNPPIISLQIIKIHLLTRVNMLPLSLPNFRCMFLLTKFLQGFHLWHAKTRTTKKCMSIDTHNLEVDTYCDLWREKHASIDMLEIEMTRITRQLKYLYIAAQVSGKHDP